jgi:hypothetical protein
MPSLRDAEGPYKSRRNNARNWRLITDDYGNEHWWLRCSSCKRFRPWLKDKRPTNYYCRDCHNHRKRREYKELQENTDRHITVLEERRFRYRDKQFAKGIEPKPQLGIGRLKYPLSQRRKERLPIEPLSEWAIKRAKAYGGNKGLAEYCGVDERTITRIVHKEYPEINFSTVDEILTNEGSTFIWDIYPNEYERLLEVA